MIAIIPVKNNNNCPPTIYTEFIKQSPTFLSQIATIITKCDDF